MACKCKHEKAEHRRSFLIRKNCEKKCKCQEYISSHNSIHLLGVVSFGLLAALFSYEVMISLILFTMLIVDGSYVWGEINQLIMYVLLAFLIQVGIAGLFIHCTDVYYRRFKRKI